MKYRLLSWLNDAWYSYLRILLSFVLFWMSKILWALSVKARALDFAMKAARYGNRASATRHLTTMIASGVSLESLVSSDQTIAGASDRSIIIKWPVFTDGSIQKGVIVITFTKTFSYYLRHVNLERMAEYFIFVLEPSSSGYADPDILSFCGKINDVIVQATAVEDRVLLNCFPDTFVPVSFGASDWVDMDIFKKITIDKIYDSIYIANTHPVKRVKRYLDAIKKIVDGGNVNYIGCLVCASWGGAEELISKLVASYNLKNNIVLKFSLNRELVVEALNQSKANVLLSLKEGSSRSLFESMSCNTPVICLSENIGVNKSYINEYTGLLVPDSFLEHSLLWLRENYDRFQPRKWAEENISPTKTTEKLCALINARLLKTDQAKDLYVKTNRPEVSYLKYESIDHKVFTMKVLQLFGNKHPSTEELQGYAPELKKIHDLFENSLLADTLIDR